MASWRPRPGCWPAAWQRPGSAGYVVLRPGATASPAEIMRFVGGEVAHYKQIRRLEVIDAIPKSAAGKILRRILRESART